MQVRLIRRRLTAACLAASLVLPAAPAWPAPQDGQCLQGDCIDGTGTLQLPSGTFTGRFSRGNFAAGRYRVTYAAVPSQAFDLDLDGDGLPVQGTVVREGDTLHAATVFTGTLERFQHPYDKVAGARFSRGRYTDSTGRIYEGSFDYIPRPFGGHYVLQGVRIDEQGDEVRTGLFVSQDVSYERPPGSRKSGWTQAIVFNRATPDYLNALQGEIREQVARANAEEAARLARERDSRESWSNFLSAAVGFVAVVGVMQLASRNSGSSAASMVGDTLRGKQSANEGTAQLVSALRERAKSDPILAGKIGTSSDSQLVALMRESRAPTTSVQEYRQAQARTAPPATGVIGSPARNPLSAATDVSTTAPAKGKLYPLRRNFTYKELGNTEREACAEVNRKIDEAIARGSLRQIVSRAPSCTCTDEALTVGGRMKMCRVAVTDQTMVDYDPNAPTTTKSK